MRSTSCVFLCVALTVVCLASVSPRAAEAGVIFGSDGNLGGGFRWDAANRSFSGQERSLVGGLRYSVQGGSWQAYRDSFAWQSTPTVVAFQTAVEQAFGAWMAVDPVSGLGTSLNFVSDFGTAVVGSGGFGGVNILGAEIDLFGTNAGDNGTRGVTSFNASVNDNVTLTTGVSGYGGLQGGGAIAGADIHINANPGAVYSLDLFRRLLTHEIGHAIGLGDVERNTIAFPGSDLGFIDDNYDGTNSTTALNTLNNSWASLVNPLNPRLSAGLTHFAPNTVLNGPVGIDTPGVNILMESEGLGIDPVGNPVTNLFPLTNDDYGTRQFLYPEFATAVPEPSSLLLFCAGLATVGLRKRSQRSRSTSQAA